MTFSHFTAGLIVLVFMTGCTSKPREITGSVFVVTSGGETKKLGLVPVQIFETGSVKLAEEKTRNTLIPELGRLMEKNKFYEANLQEEAEALFKIKQEIDDLNSELLSSFRRKPRNPRYEDTQDTSVFISTTTMGSGGGGNIDNKVIKSDPHEVYRIMATKWKEEDDALNADLKTKKQAASDLADRLEVAKEEHTAVLLRIANFNEEYQETVFSNLSSPIASTKTDGDGFFKLALPPTGDFIIAASSSRKILDKTEKYFWLFRLPKELPKNGQFSLNNDNLLVSNYSNSVVFLPIPKN